MEATYAPSARPARPAWLVAICVIAIALGGLGLVNGAWGAVVMVFQEQIQTAFKPRAQPGLPPEFQQAQEDFDQKSRDLKAQYVVPLAGSVAARMAVGLGLVVGGIWCLIGQPRGREIFMFALAAAIVFEVANSILQWVITTHMFDLTNDLLQKLADNTPNRGGPPPEFLLGFMRAVMWLSIVIGAFWQLIKFGFYLGGLLYLRRQSIAALFPSAPASSPS